MSRRHLIKLRRLGAVLCVLVLPIAGLSGADSQRTSDATWAISTENTLNAVEGLIVASPSNVNGAKAAGASTTCTSVTVTWTAAAAPANTYRVEARTANGSWTTISSDTGNVTTIDDLTLYAQREVTYRVSAGYRMVGAPFSLTNWLSGEVADATPLVCGTVGEVDDLQVTRQCNSPLAWGAAAGATTYDIQSRINGAAWGAGAGISLTNLATASYLDATSYTAGDNIEWQIRPGIGGGNDGQWSNITGLDPWGCNGPTDLTAANPCSDSNLAWSAVASATTYDVRYRENGGAWSVPAGGFLNIAALTYNDIVVHAGLPDVEYQVRAGIGTTNNGQWNGNTPMIGAWDTYRITGIAIGANGNATINPGETITVTFSKPTVVGLPSGTNSTTVRLLRNGGNRGFYLSAAGTTAANTAIAKLPIPANTTANATLTGSTGWDGTQKIWTWTSGVTSAQATPGAWTALPLVVGTRAANPGRVRCDDTNLPNLVASTITATGGWF